MNQHGTPHWTLDELTDRLYGIRDADGHLESCRECSLRLEELNRRREAIAAAPEISPAVWAAQRSAVVERIAVPSRRALRWVPALTAAVCLLGVALLVHRPMPMAPQHADTGTAISDAQLFSDIYNVEESSEPLAAAPIHELFQEDQP